jgi:biopolymer transport protein TolR
MAFSSSGNGAGAGPQINVTPLIDVLLTLIVMFMLAVAMDKQYQEKTLLPQPQNKGQNNPQLEGTIVIQVVWTKDQPPAVKINHDDVPWDNLDSRLTQIYLTRAEKVAFVRSDADVDFQYVAEVIDVAHHAGVRRVGLLTQDRMIEGE